MIRRLMRYGVEISLWLAVLGLSASAIVHAMTFFGAGLNEGRDWDLAVPMHLTLMIVGAFTVLMYKARGEAFDATSIPTWSKRLMLVLLAYFVLNMVLLVKRENSSQFELRFFSSGWLLGYSAIAAYLWRLRDGLRPGFREIELR